MKPTSQSIPADPPDPYQGERFWRFVITNLIAIGLAVAIFIGFLYGDRLDQLFQGIYNAFYTYDLLAVFAAISPLFATVLIGTYYAGRRRKNKSVPETPSS